MVPDGDDYVALSLRDLLERVASPEPMPGAGFVAATAVAMAAALLVMAARSSGDWHEARGASAQAEALRERAVSLAKRNVQVYAEALASLKGRGDEPGGGDDAIGRALARAAQVPLLIGAVANDVSALAATVAEHGNPSLRADAAVAASLALAGARAAATLVEVNLTTTAADPRVAEAREHVADASLALDRALAAVG